MFLGGGREKQINKEWDSQRKEPPVQEQMRQSGYRGVFQ